MNWKRDQHPYAKDMRVLRGGRIWLILLVGCSMRNGFTLSDLQHINPSLFKDDRKSRELANRAIKRAVDMGLIDRIDDSTFKLNSNGKRYVTLVSRYWSTVERDRTRSSA